MFLLLLEPELELLEFLLPLELNISIHQSGGKFITLVIELLLVNGIIEVKHGTDTPFCSAAHYFPYPTHST